MQPRHYQTAANDAAWNFLRNQAGSPLIVLPTGAGKSLVIAMLCRQAITYGARVVVLQHRKELIMQNAEKIQILLPEQRIGLYSAGIGKRNTSYDIICAGIQSVFRKALELGRRELVIVDEAHLISGNEDSMYGTFLSDLMSVNQRMRVVGLTATPYRTGEGPLCGKNKLFQRICHESLTGDLIKEGWLCSITNKPAESTIDTSGIKKIGGEFVNADAQRVFDSGDNVSQAVTEIVRKCADRHSVLLFSAGVIHAEHIAETLRAATGERVEVVTGETFPMERAAALDDFKNQKLRWLVNCDVLTTGFDAPCIDAICVLRATMSPGLFAQIVGRGLRKHESKTDCLILDFGENIKRHGSLDDPNYGRCSVSRGGSIEASDNNGRGKACPNCGIDVASRSIECHECGFLFPVKHEATADDDSQLTGQAPPESWIVQRVSWFRHTKRNDPEAPPTLRIDYECQPADCEGGNLSVKHISEWVCIEHEGFARTKAGLWWQARSISECPNTVEDALSLLNRGACRMASHLVTVKEGKFYKIKSCEFVDEIPEEWEPERDPEAVEEFSGFENDVPF